MICKNCGQEIPNESHFCRFCGVPVEYVKSPAPAAGQFSEPQNHRSGKKYTDLWYGDKEEWKVEEDPLRKGNSMPARIDWLAIDLGSVISRAAVITEGEPVLFSTENKIPYYNGRRLTGSNKVISDRQPCDCKKYIGTWSKENTSDNVLSEEVAAAIIKKLITDAEKQTGHTFSKAVFAVPESFDLAQIKAMGNIAYMAGLKDYRCIHDTGAAALYYTCSCKLMDDRKYLFINMGMGYLGISCCEYSIGVVEVLSVASRQLPDSYSARSLPGLVETLVNEALSEAGYGPSEIETVYIAGGNSGQPDVLEALRKRMGGVPIHKVSPDVPVKGLAMYSGKLMGDTRYDEVLLLDVLPKGIYIETMGGVLTPLIPKGCTIPTRTVKEFATSADNQTALDVHLVMGDDKDRSHNRTIACVRFDNLPLAKKGEVLVEIEIRISWVFDITGSIREKKTGREMQIRFDLIPELTMDVLDGIRSRVGNMTAKTAKPNRKEDPAPAMKEPDVAVTEILSVYDSITYGILNMQGTEKDSAALRGMIATQKQMLTALEKMGIVPINALNQKFDPYLHEAVDHINDPALPDDYVVKEIRTGFKKGDKLLRASQVIVAN